MVSTRTTPGAASTPALRDWSPKALYDQTLRTLPREHGFEDLRVEGTLPDGLRGALYRAGPALFESFGMPYAHPFEADGGVTAVRITGDGASGASRVVQSEGLRAERAAGRALYGSGAPWLKRVAQGLRREAKNTANTSVMHWQGRIFALMEGALPTEMDPHTLQTRGETDFDGVVRQAFSAHPHTNPVTGTLYNFGLRYGKETMLDMYVFPTAGAPTRVTSFAIPYATMVHDFSLAGRYAVFTVAPAKLVLWRAMLQIGGFDQFFKWDADAPTALMIVDLDAPHAPPRRIDVPAHWVWHFGNAFVDKGDIVLDACRYPDLGSLGAIGGSDDVETARLSRTRIALGTGGVSTEQLCDGASEFPVTNPAAQCGAHGHTWLLRDEGPARFDHETGRLDQHVLPAGHIASEPIFVPRAGGGEADGWILSLVLDANSDTSHFTVLDAAKMHAAPVARLHFDHHIPLTFHGVWVDAG